MGGQRPRALLQICAQGTSDNRNAMVWGQVRRRPVRQAGPGCGPPVGASSMLKADPGSDTDIAGRHQIAVLVPCYNEEVSIAKVVGDFRAALPTATIYVYDNNSSDR